MEQLCQLSGTAGRFDSNRCRGLSEEKKKSPTLKKTEGRAPETPLPRNPSQRAGHPPGLGNRSARLAVKSKKWRDDFGAKQSGVEGAAKVCPAVGALFTA
jgi:hypothetical protein